MRNTVFMGLAYVSPYRERFAKAVAERPRDDWQVVMPLGREAGGLLLDRIADLIRRSDRCLFDVSVANANVWFEVGIAIASGGPLRLLTDRDPNEIADLLRGVWLDRYHDDADCIAKVDAYLAEPAPMPTVNFQPAGATPDVTVVLGEGELAAALAERFRSFHTEVVIVAPTAIRSLQEAFDVARSAGKLVLVLPESDTPWLADASIGAWITAGIAYGLGRRIALGAHEGTPIPSDCPALVSRGTDADSLGAAIVSALDRSPPKPPPAGVGVPQLAALQPRSLVQGLVTSLTHDGAGALIGEPGYAKTSTAYLVAKAGERATAWVTALPSQSSAELLESVVSALGEHVPDIGWEALTAARSRSAAVTSGANEAVPDLAERVGQFLVRDVKRVVTTSTVLLVIDDVHLVPEDGTLLSELVRQRPDWLQILLAGWSLPGRLALGPGMPVVRADGLRFSRDETQTFLRSRLPSISDAHIEVLHEVTEGWPAALAVARAWLVLAPEVDADALRAQVSPGRHDIYGLFARAFWGYVPSDHREMLLRAGVLPQLGPDEAGEFLRDRLAARALADGPYFLEQTAVGGVFRFHSLFRDFLQLRWKEERGEASLREFQATAARWYEGRGETAFALDLALAAQDWDRAAEILSPFARMLANSGDGRMLINIVERFPAEVLRRTRTLHETYVRALYYVGDARANAEAELLVARTDGTPAERAMATMILVSLKHDNGQLDDVAAARAFDAIAHGLGDDDLQIKVQARFKSFAARCTRDPDSSRWPGYYAEAMELAELAAKANVRSIKVEALGQAAATLQHMSDLTLSQAANALRLASAIGFPIPSLEARAEMARQLMQMQDLSSKLYRDALAEPDDSGPVRVSKCIVRMQRARSTAYTIAMQVFRDGVISDDATGLGEAAISELVDVVRVLDQLGLDRNAIIGLTAVAEVADAIDNKSQRDQWAAHAAKVADERGYADLAGKARRLIGKETPLDTARAAFGNQPATGPAPT